MKKAIGLVCGLTILSACSSDDKTLANSGRRAPMLNDASIGAPVDMSAPMYNPMVGMPGEAPEPPSFGMPGTVGPRPNPSGIAAMSFPSEPVAPMPPASVTSAPLTPPPLGGTQFSGYPQQPQQPQLIAQVSDSPEPLKAASSAAPAAEERRLPEFNRTVLNNSEVAQVPEPGFIAMPKLPSAPVPPAPPAPIQNDAYPKLAEVPPSPQVTPSIHTDSRVQELKQDLASMEQNTASMPPQPPLPPAPIAPKITVKQASAETAPLAPLPPVPPVMPPYMAEAQPPVASTSVADLRPISSSAHSSAFVPSTVEARTNYTSLKPITSVNKYKLLPESRYSKVRAGVRNVYKLNGSTSTR